MHGEYRGANYPEAYSDRDREEFHRRSVAAEQCYPNLFGPAGLHPTIDLTRDRDHMGAGPDTPTSPVRPGGTWCGSIRMVACIAVRSRARPWAISCKARGSATECAPCSRSCCVYFCEKHTALPRDQMALATAQ